MPIDFMFVDDDDGIREYLEALLRDRNKYIIDNYDLLKTDEKLAKVLGTEKW